MNIGVFETQHFEGAYPMIRILDLPGNHLIIFVDGDTHRRFSDLFGPDMNRFTWIVKPEKMSDRRFVWQIYKTCKKQHIQLLFLNTVTAHFIYYGWLAALLRSVKVILTLHDANAFLRSHFSFNLRRSVRHAGKKILGFFCYAYSTVAETVEEHLKDSGITAKNIFCIPGAVFEKQQDVRMQYDYGHLLKIVIAGSIDNRRRDYYQVFELLNFINKYNLPVVVTVAGGPYSTYGEEMIARFRVYNEAHTNLHFYETPVLDQDVFDRELDATHFLWIPSVVHTIIDDGIEETYGLTKSSGNIFDAIKHAKPLLVPEQLAVSAQIQSSVRVYHSVESLAAFLQNITEDVSLYNKMAEQAYLNSMKYTIEKMRGRITALL